MFGESVYLRALPKFGALELCLARVDDGLFLAKARHHDGFGDTVFVLEHRALGGERAQYSTRRHEAFSIVETGERRLIDGSHAEIAKFYFARTRDPLEMRFLDNEEASMDHRRLEELYREQQSLHDVLPGRIALRKAVRVHQTRLEHTVGRSPEIEFATHDEAILWRGVRSLQAIDELAAADEDYRDALADLRQFKLGALADDAVFSATLAGDTLELHHSRAKYLATEVTDAWLRDNL